MPPADIMPIPGPSSRPLDSGRFLLDELYSLLWRGVRYEVRAGFEWDGASIPRALWRVCGHPLDGRVQPAALIHDALYASEWVTREFADELFRDLLRANGVGRLRAWCFLRAVRNFGGPTWRRHTPESIAAARELVTLYLEETVE